MGFLSKFLPGTKPDKASKDEVQAAIAVSAEPALIAAVESVSATLYERLKRDAAALLDVAKYAEAELVYRQALAENPTAAEAHLNLGYVLKEQGQIRLSQECLERAIVLTPRNFDAHFMLAMLCELNQPEQALRAIEHALSVEPGSKLGQAFYYKLLAHRYDFERIEAHATLICSVPGDDVQVLLRKAAAFASIEATGPLKIETLQKSLAFFDQALARDVRQVTAWSERAFVLLALDQVDHAMASFDMALQVKPDDGELHQTLGLVNRQLGRFDSATAHAEKAIVLLPKQAPTHKLLGDIHHEFGKYAAAIACYEKAIVCKPDFAEAFMMLAMSQADAGQTSAALQSSQKVIDLKPDAPEAHFNAGNVFLALKQYSQAIKAFHEALRLRPHYISAHINLGAAYMSMADYPSALKACHDILDIDPRQPVAFSNISFCSSFDADCAPQDYLRYARQYGEVVSSFAKPYTTWHRSPLEGRALKVGLVSSDLLMHPVGFFLESVIAYIDTEKIEFHAFSNKFSDDPLQASLKSRVKSWTSIMGLPDAAAAKLIHEAGLDLLIDLSGHTMGNRLPLFCWRAAPVQATWLGYWASTGVSEIDFVLADTHCVPLHSQDQFIEKVCYLPDTRYCFTPPTRLRDLPVGPSPSKKNGFITFGSYQPMRKLTTQVLTAWAAVQQQLPGSRFLLRGKGYTDPKTHAELMRRLTSSGIAEGNVTLLEGVPRLSYLESHRDVDMILDSFPYPGGTTTCDALWMGVPTVTLAGNSMLSRQGVGLMACAGLSDWVADSRDQYITIAVEKASQPKELTAIRQRLRQTVFESPLFNAPGFAIDLDKALWDMVKSKAPC